MNAEARPDSSSPPPADNAAQLDAAVRKAEEAEKRLHRAEDGPLGVMGDEDTVSGDADAAAR